MYMLKGWLLCSIYSDKSWGSIWITQWKQFGILVWSRIAQVVDIDKVDKKKEVVLYLKEHAWQQIATLDLDKHYAFWWRFLYTSDSRFPFDTPIKIFDYDMSMER